RDMFVMSEEIVKKQVAMTSDLHSVKADMESYDSHFRELESFSLNTSASIQRIARDTDTLDTKALFLAQNINAVKKSLPELNNKISLLAENISDIKYDTDKMKESNDRINVAVISLNDSVNIVKLTSTNTSRMIMKMQQDVDGCKALLEPIVENAELLQNIDQDIAVLNITIHDLKSLENDSNQVLLDINKTMQSCKSPLNETIGAMLTHLKDMDYNRTQTEHVILNSILMAAQDRDGQMENSIQNLTIKLQSVEDMNVDLANNITAADVEQDAKMDYIRGMIESSQHNLTIKLQSVEDMHVDLSNNLTAADAEQD
ncbi:unnamed protein product, partial [Meganyctiphanes norvegica]